MRLTSGPYSPAQSLLPRHSTSGASALSVMKSSSEVMSPAWTMRSQPSRASSSSFESLPWVSEMTSMRLAMAAYRPSARLSWTTRRRETEIFLPSTPWMPSCMTPLETTSTSSTYCRFTM